MDACNAFCNRAAYRGWWRGGADCPSPSQRHARGNEPSETAIPGACGARRPVGKHHDNFSVLPDVGLATALAMPLLLQFHASGVPGVRAFMLANALTVLSLLLYAAGSFLR